MAEDRVPRGSSRMQIQLDLLLANQGKMMTEQALMKQEQLNVKHDVGTKHVQNRKDIHEIRGILEKLIADLWNIKLSNARWNIGAGVMTAIILKVIDHFIK